MTSLIPSLLIFFLGASIGSFLNVVIYRVPAGLSLLYPPSRCPKCQRQLKLYDNVPVLGWLWLRGRCRFCKRPIAVRYPLVEFLMGALFLGAFWHFGWSESTLSAWILLSWLVALTFIDIDTLTLPESLTRSGLVLGLTLPALWAYLTASEMAVSVALTTFISSLFGAVLGLWLFSGISIAGAAFLGQTAMGWGDSKLAAMLGAWLGWAGLLLSTFLACFLGAMIGGSAIALGRLSRRQPMPFGPFLAVGGAIALFWGEHLIAAYLHVFFPLNWG
ncbi:prepilin peptidase [Almyronema epifaneia]|uniref:Prepilin peptidase n=1 Tax=Almyronema epifaneia S1 TaxID=2991925 RepID=A0ABW6IHW0_9CYAN